MKTDIGSRWRMARRWLVALPVLLVMASPAWPLTVNPPTFTELVNESGRIMRARVIAIEPFRTTTPDGTNVIKTRVTWTVERTLKGAAATTLSLDFLGGRLGTDWLRVPGMPQFKVGADEYLFVEPNESVLCPLLAAGHGRYRIRSDAKTGREFIARDNGAPLTDVAQIGQPMAETTATATADSAAQAFSPNEFEARIQQVLGGGNGDKRANQ